MFWTILKILLTVPLMRFCLFYCCCSQSNVYAQIKELQNKVLSLQQEMANYETETRRAKVEEEKLQATLQSLSSIADYRVWIIE